MKKLLFLIAICLFISSNSFAWDDTGHKLTTYIAWAQMTPQAREKVFNLLMAAPEDSDLSVFYLQGSRSEEAKRLELFMIASTWADIIRDNKNFKARNKKYHHGNWHYLDTLWSEENGKISIVPKTEEEGENAVERLFVFDKLMRDATKLDDDKAIALAWFLHLGGDIHQPLHCSGRVTSWAAKGDQGGNLFSLTPKDTPREKRENLHWYWDSIIGRNISRVNDACDSSYLPTIAKRIMKKFPQTSYANRLKIGKYDEWQKEGFELASKEVYKNGLKDFEMPSDKYKKRAYVISQEQIALAGYRMGQTLNEMFGK
jgi:S1/P1 Nuclease